MNTDMSRTLITNRPIGSPTRLALLQRLVEELKNPETSHHEPNIIEDKTPPRFGNTDAIRLYVVWNDWSDLDRQARSEIIMEAYQESEGLEEALKVTLAMGLTPDEARRMGLI